MILDGWQLRITVIKPGIETSALVVLTACAKGKGCGYKIHATNQEFPSLCHIPRKVAGNAGKP